MKTTALKKFGSLAYRYRIALIMGAVVVIAFGVVFGKDRKPLPVDATSPRLIRAYTVGSTGGDPMEYTGVIHARTESDLGFRVPGKIVDKLVKAGDRQCGPGGGRSSPCPEQARPRR